MDPAIHIRRVRDPLGNNEGTRVLVDRIWPRGLRRADVVFDHWLKEVTPSPPLRRWFGHDPAHWDEFRLHYLAELGAMPANVAVLLDLCEDPPVTLLYDARDRQHNHAVVLREFLRHELERTGGSPPCELATVAACFGLDGGRQGTS